MSSNAISPIIEMSKGACFGQCPTYRLSVYEDGTILYEGKRFTDRIGIHSRQLTDTEYSTIQHNLSNLRWDEYQEYYDSRLPDLQMVTMKKGAYTVKFKEDSPRELQVLSDLLSMYADQGAWDKLAHHGNAPDYIQNEITVQLKEGYSANDLLMDMQIASVSIHKEVSATMNTWLLKYDNQEISAGQLYYALQQSPKVLKVEFNVQLKLRDE
jgi:hypothetical protein